MRRKHEMLARLEQVNPKSVALPQIRANLQKLDATAGIVGTPAR
jgi:hypothetical protein